MERYQIGDVIFTWKDGNFPLKQSRYMQQFCVQKFEKKTLEDEVVYETHFVELKKHKGEKLLQKNGLYELYDTSEGKIVIYHWASCRFAFGFLENDLEKGNVVPCYVNPALKEEIPVNTVKFLSCVGLHSKLLQRGAVVFHAAYIDWNGKAVLFAGHSGVGKSTQADLWVRYAGAEIINGDRALIRRKKGVWNAYGYPCCGSSDFCLNRTLPLSAIVLLEQGKENKICLLSKGQKFRALFAGSEMYLWNEKEMQYVSQIAEEIIEEIKIIKIVCRPDAEAVEVLRKELEDFN